MNNFNFRNQIINHLNNYKNNYLKISENGFWRGREYSHILPEDKKNMNIIEEIRVDFWNYYDKLNNLKLHTDFSHLNSSQALCFNLFFPFLQRYKYLVPFFVSELEVLNRRFSNKKEEYSYYVPTENIKCEFEKVIDKNEFTNFDFFISFDEFKVLFELKYTESGFGTAKNDIAHIDKINNIYKPKLKNILKSDKHPIEFYLEHYQILRNICYLEKDKTAVVFIIPEKNEKLYRLKDFLDENLSENFKENCRVFYLEKLVRILSNKDDFIPIHHYFEKISEKYILEKE
jgi:hypothetical protein